MDKTNLIVFPGGRRKNKADKLLGQFINVSVIRDADEQREAYTELREAIYDYLPDYQVNGDKQS